MVELVFLLLVLTGIADLILIWTDNDTISQWYHRLLPKKYDFVIVIALTVLVYLIWGGHVMTVWTVGVVAGHLLWSQD